MANNSPVLKKINFSIPKGPIPLHPFALALYPILALAGANIANFPLLQAANALWFSLLAAVVLWGIFTLITRNWHTAGGLTTLIFLLFYAYGHLYGLIFKESDETIWFSVLWGVILVGGGWWVISHPALMKTLTKPLNVVGIVLLLFPLYAIGSYNLKSQSSPSRVSDISSTQTTKTTSIDLPTGVLPDVYYIVLDGYARGDVLTELYDFDNQPLLDHLRSLGFYIADESHTNYNQTFLSVPSSLNMAYINDLMEVEPDTPYDYKKHVRLVDNSEVERILAELGYEMVNFNSGHGLTSIVNADHYLRPENTEESLFDSSINFFGKSFPLTSFEALLLETTALRPFLPKMYQSMAEPPKFQRHRDRILYTFSHLADLAQADGNYFTFTHIITPHPPFVFEADGEPKLHTDAYSIADGTHFVGRKGSRAEYIDGYRNQLTYVNTLLVETVEQILAQSETPPVIILQADHGPGAYFDWHSVEKTDNNERMSIFNAYYFPGGDEGWLYPSITPVNTFRVVLNRYFDYDLELLEDLSYFSDWSTPYDFIDITELLKE
jgi:hypothetical protein